MLSGLGKSLLKYVKTARESKAEKKAVILPVVVFKGLDFRLKGEELILNPLFRKCISIEKWRSLDFSSCRL